VFFRATDENLALIGDDEDLDEVLKGKSPRAKDNNKRKDAQTSQVSAQPLKRIKINDNQDDFSVALEFAQSTLAMASASERMTLEANKLELLHLDILLSVVASYLVKGLCKLIGQFPRACEQEIQHLRLLDRSFQERDRYENAQIFSDVA